MKAILPYNCTPYNRHTRNSSLLEVDCEYGVIPAYMTRFSVVCNEYMAISIHPSSITIRIVGWFT